MTARPLYNLAARLIPLLEPERSENDQLIEVGRQARALQDGALQVRDVRRGLVRARFARASDSRRLRRA
jgi:hypothetical protein